LPLWFLLVAPGPSISLAPESACAPRTALARELRRLGLSLVDAGALQLRLTPRDDQVELVLLRDGEVLLHRSFRGACEDAAGATAVVVERYLRELAPVAPPDAGATAPSQPRPLSPGAPLVVTPASSGPKPNAVPNVRAPSAVRAGDVPDSGVASPVSIVRGAPPSRTSASTTPVPEALSPSAASSSGSTAPGASARVDAASGDELATPAPLVTAPAQPATVTPPPARGSEAISPREERATEAPSVTSSSVPSAGANRDDATGRASPMSVAATPSTNASASLVSSRSGVDEPPGPRDAGVPAAFAAAVPGGSASPAKPAPPAASSAPPDFAVLVGGGFVTPAPSAALTPALSLEPQVALGPWRVSLLGVFSFGGSVPVLEGAITRGTLSSRDAWVLPSLGLCAVGRWSVCGALLVGGRMVFAEASGPYLFHANPGVGGGLAAGAGADLTFTVGPLRVALSAALLVNPTPTTAGLVGLGTTLTTPVLEGLVRLSVGLGSARIFP
jgi:hypothetical protein